MTLVTTELRRPPRAPDRDISCQRLERLRVAALSAARRIERSQLERDHIRTTTPGPSAARP
ncbi:MAG: hypothetical protein ACR2OG_09740 [Gemmatimonadaceae bacterium]